MKHLIRRSLPLLGRSTQI
jgi:hypothetical protein